MPVTQTANVTGALVEAYGIANEKRNEFLTPEHLVAGFLKDRDFWDTFCRCGRAEELESDIYGYINGLDKVPEEQELTKSEYERLLTEAKRKGNEKLYLLMQTICSTGIRVSELKYITVESLSARKATINLKGKMRIVIISNSLCKMLAKYAKKKKIKSGSIFVTKNNNPLDRSNIWKLMKKLCESAKVAKEKVYPHNLRHLFARTFYSVQKDIVRLADILGHSSVNTTRIYTMESGEVHRRQIQKLGLLRL